jgi:ligand-binding SRPBCC domain-containing protein
MSNPADPTTPAPGGRLLDLALTANAAFSTLSGGAMLAAGPWLAPWLGMPAHPASATALQVTGLGLLGFAAALVFIAARRATPLEGLLFSAGDLGWVASTGLLMLLTPDVFDTTGWIAAWVVADLVAMFAGAQLVGAVLRSRNPSRRTRSRQQHSATFDAPIERVWPIIADQPGLGDAAPGLAFVRLEPGVTDLSVGTVRSCGSHDGQTWTERCTALEPGRSFTVTANTSASDWPFPLTQLVGTWMLTEASGRTRVDVVFEYTMRGGLLGELMAISLMRQAQARSWRTILSVWESRARSAVQAHAA